ncbi:CaiB/BaiF CoA transferase family protein [Pseudorhodoplanes sp.]|uniref:CaiB/BaiF CoA transferase family protein n=1 Tax=Pseudorhodoplanes sp. TaxID=1934341 RepID=UPI003D0C39B3
MSEAKRAPLAGPLAGLRVIEMDALGPVPFCAMLLAGMGADVIHIARPGQSEEGLNRRIDVLQRGRPSVQTNVKSPEGVALVKNLAARADILIEGLRPGVMERLGLGPDILMGQNPRLIYGRMTGWGQSGPLSQTAGHDINYIALSGALHAIGRADERPVPPLNLVGDYGGGALYLALGVLAASIDVAKTGRGQVVDAAMIDGAASLMSVFCAFAANGMWVEERGANLLDGGAPWYDTYEARDGRYIAVGALEEQFWAALLDGLGLKPDDLPPRGDRANWPIIRERLASVFATKTRDEWAAQFVGTDACVSPVLSLSEARSHPHIISRQTFVELEGVSQPAPAPRFERGSGCPAPASWIEPTEALRRWPTR